MSVNNYDRVEQIRKCAQRTQTLGGNGAYQATAPIPRKSVPTVDAKLCTQGALGVVPREGLGPPATLALLLLLVRSGGRAVPPVDLVGGQLEVRG